MSDASRPPEQAAPETGLVLLGRVLGAFGVRGELKIESFTEPKSAILRYRPWILRDAQGRERELDGVRGRDTGKGPIASFPDVVDRDAAEALRGTEIYISRTALPPAKPDEYYWADLEGLRVTTLEGVELGTVSHLLATGANDVLVVHGERERMLPFVQPDCIRQVDLETGVITVEWDPEF